MAIITDTTGARIASAIENLPGLSLSKTDVVDNLTSNSTTKALSANQGRVLDGKITTANTNITSVDNKVPFSFGVDNNGKYGYIKNGENIVTPFFEPEEEEEEEQEETTASYYKSFITFQSGNPINDYHASSYINRWLGGMNTNSGVYRHHGMNPYVNSTIRTKDFVICYDAYNPYTDGASSTNYSRLFAIDKKGKRYTLQSKMFSGLCYKPYRQLPMIFGAFDINIYETYPQYANYWYVMQAGTKYIEVFDGIEYLGSIDMSALGWLTEFPNNSEYHCIMTCPSRTKPEILVYRNYARVAYILGIDALNNLNIFSAKAIPLVFNNISTETTEDIYLICNRIYATDYGWCGLNQQYQHKNVIFKIDDNGTGTAYTLSSLHTTNTYDGTLGALLEKDGRHLTIAVNSYYNSQAFYNTNFIRLDSNNLANTVVLHSAYRWAHPSYTHQPFSYKAFFDTNDYIYFIPTVGYGMYYTSNTNITHNTTCLYTLPFNVSSNPTQTTVINTYCRINKSTGAFEYLLYPWAQTGQTNQSIRWIRTKDDYVWLLPPRNLLNGLFGVITPNDEIKQVDIGTTAYRWCGAVPMAGWSDSSRYPYQHYAPRSAVNDDGIGCIIDNTGSCIMLFWGDCNFRLKTFNTQGVPDFGVEQRLIYSSIGRDQYLDNVDYNMSCAIGSIANKFIIANTYGDYMQYAILTPPEDLTRGTIEVTHCAPYYPGQYAGRWIYNSDAWDYNNLWLDYHNHKKVNNMVLPLSFGQGAAWGWFTDTTVEKPQIEE